MKNLTSLSLLTLNLVCISALAQTMPDWKASVKVLDETGQPIPYAGVEVAYRLQPASDGAERWAKIAGKTDVNGFFNASHSFTSVFLTFQASKAGYYGTSQGYDLPFEYRPEKWNPSITLILKQVIHPIPMYAKVVGYSAPTNNSPVGFDLTAGDWVSPYGKGIRTDIIFTTEFSRRSKDDYDYKFAVSFPNKGDGIQGFGAPDRYSALLSPHEAPAEGYEPQIIKSNNQRPGQTATYIWDEKTNYFFRVRTSLDEHGAVKSALYGKIYGDFNRFRYYLNPTPNDRNVEFDPKQNLLKGLRGVQAVNVP